MANAARRSWPWPELAFAAAFAFAGLAVVAATRAAGFAAGIASAAAVTAAIFAAAATVSRRQLLQAEARCNLGQQALDALPQAIFVIDALRPGRSNSYVNSAYAALTGYSAAEAIATGFDALGVFVEPGTVAALDRDGTELPVDAAVGVRRRDGTPVPAKLGLRAVAQRDGGRLLVGVLEALPAAPLPASTVSPGTVNSPFLSWLNHELRSPLNACGMWLDVLALAPQPDKITKAVDAIKRNLARQTRLVNDLNDAAKVPGDALEMRMTGVDLVSLVQRGLQSWLALAQARPLTLECRIDLEAATVDGDAERLLQAMTHVLENAIGSTPSGGQVELHVHEAGGQCRIVVEDGGTALSADDAANIGAPLWRAPKSAKSRSGLGLGLAVAHHIFVKHRGSLAASSGKVGTRFVMTIPLTAGGAPQIVGELGRAAGP